MGCLKLEILEKYDNLKITFRAKNTVFSGDLDYYPFGMEMPDRTNFTQDWRFGYQGLFAERDGLTGKNDFMLRQYDSRLARWKTKDPMGQYASPYMAMGNNPVSFIDPSGGWDEYANASMNAEDKHHWDGGWTPTHWDLLNTFGYTSMSGQVGDALGQSGWNMDANGDWSRTTEYEDYDMMASVNDKIQVYSRTADGGLTQGTTVRQKTEYYFGNNSNSSYNLNPVNNAVGLAGLGWGILENTIKNDNYWLGKNLKYYGTDKWTNGNKWTGSMKQAEKFVKPIRNLGRIAFGINAVYGAVTAYDKALSGDYSGTFLAGMGVVHSAISTYGGPAGLFISGPYILIDATVGMDKFMNSTINLQNDRVSKINSGDYSMMFNPRFGQSVR